MENDDDFNYEIDNDDDDAFIDDNDDYDYFDDKIYDETFDITNFEERKSIDLQKV